jgi:SAM-dependent methyltransferase
MQFLNPSEGDVILDLGSGDGSHIASIVPFRKNVYIADIDKHALERGKTMFGFNIVHLDENGTIPFPDKTFDIVFCSSVIEHVSVDKDSLTTFRSNRDFASMAFQRQLKFADEIRRVGKRYFDQTPYKYFIIESHTWLPFVILFLPRSWQIGIVRFLNRFWPKKTQPDWNLLTIQQMRTLFPDGEIMLEKQLGLTKSVIAVKGDRKYRDQPHA